MNNREKNVEDTLNSLEGMQRATPGSFFFTRVSARLQREQRNPWQNITRLITRPAIIITGLCLIVLLNTWVIVNSSAKETASNQTTELGLADEYAIASNNFYYESNNEGK